MISHKIETAAQSPRCTPQCCLSEANDGISRREWRADPQIERHSTHLYNFVNGPARAAPPSNPLGDVILRTRDAANRHPWFVDLFGGRPHQGPNALVYLEASLAALHNTPGFGNIDDVLRAIRTVNAFIIGGVKSEAAEYRQCEETCQTKAEWQEATSAYVLRMIATGRFPTIDAVVYTASMSDGELGFEKGFQIVLDGIALAQLSGIPTGV